MKKGISPLIASVILIAFVIAIGSITYTFFTGFSESTKLGIEEKKSGSVSCALAALEIDRDSVSFIPGNKTLIFYSTSSDGYIGYDDSSYTTANDASSGETIDNDSIEMKIGQRYQSGIYDIWRSYLFFDTHSIPDNANLKNITLSLYGKTDSSNQDFYIVIHNGQSTYPHSPLELGDYHKNKYNPTEELSPDVPMVWPFWELGDSEITPVIFNYYHDNVNLINVSWVVLSSQQVDLENLTWDNMEQNINGWSSILLPISIQSNHGVALSPISISPGDVAVIVRYNVKVDGNVVARFIGEALLSWSGSTPSFNDALTNLGQLNKLDQSVDSFDLKIKGINQDNVTETYEDPMMVTDDGTWVNITWINTSNPISPSEWSYYGIRFEKGIGQVDIPDMKGNWSLGYGTFDTSGFTTSGYNNISVGDFSIINKSGVTKLTLLSSRDTTANDTFPDNYEYIDFYSGESSNLPKLIVEYEAEEGIISLDLENIGQTDLSGLKIIAYNEKGAYTYDASPSSISEGSKLTITSEHPGGTVTKIKVVSTDCPGVESVVEKENGEWKLKR